MPMWPFSHAYVQLPRTLKSACAGLSWHCRQASDAGAWVVSPMPHSVQFLLPIDVVMAPTGHGLQWTLPGAPP